MRPTKKSIWALLLSTFALGQCGRQSKRHEGPTSAVSLPADWDGSEDWSGNVLRVEDITP